MPHPRAFLGAFGLYKGAKISDGIILSKVNIKHVVVEKYRKYTFPLVVELTSLHHSSDYVLEHFKTYIGGNKIVNSQYGNPYDCSIRDFSIKLSGSQTLISEKKDKPAPKVNIYSITCMGYGNRIASR
jgi:hypothetical protein